MTDKEVKPARRGTETQTVAAWTVFAIALLIIAQGGFLLLMGFDRDNFAESAGIGWDSFAAANPEAAAHLDGGGPDRVAAVTMTGLGIYAAVLAYGAVQRARPMAKTLIWILPAVLTGWGLVLLPTGDTTIGVPSLIAGLLTAALTPFSRQLLTRPSPTT
ncbi:MAG: hypothetical protein WB239_08915 [Acidimicrobiia bacterium]